MTILCKKCNKKFKSMLSFLHHNCPNEDKYNTWECNSRSSKESRLKSKPNYPNWLSESNRDRLRNKLRNDLKATGKQK